MARTRIAAALLVIAIASDSAGSTGQSNAARPGQAPGEGVLCLWAMTSVAAEVGRQCRAGANPAVQHELDDAVARFEAYVRRNSEATDAEIGEFRRRQGLGGADNSRLCHGDPLRAYDEMAAAGAERVRREVDRMLARPGRPAWGDCL